MSRRYELTDSEWDRIESLLPGKPGDAGGRGKDNRLFVNAVVWGLRTGAPWRDLPERFGIWNSVYVRFNRWSKSGVWTRVFRELQDPDLSAMMLDSTVIRAHQHAAGAARKDEETGGESPQPTNAVAEKKNRRAKRSAGRGAGSVPSSTSRLTRTASRSNSSSAPARNTT